MRKEGETATLNVQDLNSTERYRVGTYDLEVLTLPRLYIPGRGRQAERASPPVSIPQRAC